MQSIIRSGLSTKIKNARTKLGLTGLEAARAWRVNPRTLQDYEQGRRTPRGLALNAINDILDPILAAAGTPGPVSSESPGQPSNGPSFIQPPPLPPKEKRARHRKSFPAARTPRPPRRKPRTSSPRY